MRFATIGTEYPKWSYISPPRNGAGNAAIPRNAARLPMTPALRSGDVQFAMYVWIAGTHVAAVSPLSTDTRTNSSGRDEPSHPIMIGTPIDSEKRMHRLAPNRFTNAPVGGRKSRKNRPDAAPTPP